MHLAVVFCLLWLIAGRATAQQVTGALQGVVLAPDSTPEPGVRLTLTGPNLQGVRATETDRQGFFQLLALPPGEYQLRLAHIGYQPVVIQRVLVELGRATTVGRVILTQRPLELDSIVVVAPPFTIDPVHTDAGGTLDAEDYAALPVDRDYKSIISVLPHANESTRGDPVNVAGSTGLENQYYIDGVNVSDPRTADRATNLPYNFVRAVEVKTGGYEARYGRALGAVVNAITYSGTNDFEVNLFGFAQPGGLALEPRAAPIVREAGAVSYDIGARVSGPLKRDRLWYSAALNPRREQRDKEVTGHGLFRDRTTATLFATKLTWRASSTTDLELSVFGDPSEQDRVDPPPPGISSVTNPDALLARVRTGGVVGSLRAAVAPSPRVLLETSVARQWDQSSTEGATALGRSAERYVDQVQSLVEGGLGFKRQGNRGRTGLSARGTFALARHTVVAGVEYEDAEVTSRYEDTGLGEIVRDQAASFSTNSRRYSGTFHNRSPAIYAQDSWRLTERFTLNAGLRWSGQHLLGASGRTAQRIPDEWQPRAGVSWQVGRLGTARLFGSYGRFYMFLPNFLSEAFFVDWIQIVSQYSTDPRQPGAVLQGPPSDYSTPETFFAIQIPGLHADNFDEFTLGYERLVGAGSRLTIRGMHRRLRSSFQIGFDTTLTSTIPFVFGTPGRGALYFLPPPRREYAALEISAEGAWRRLRYRASYVLSRTRGNYTGLYGSDLGVAAPNANDLFWTPWQARNSTGLLPNDRTHVFKLSTAFSPGLGLASGAFLTWQSGSPINAFAPGFPDQVGAPTFEVPRGTAGRTPALWNLDLRLGYDLPLSRGPRSRVQLDLLHVGNPRGTTRVDEVQYTLRDSNGNPTSPNPRYQQPVAYQSPMAARLGLELSF